jgi:hypothetical protein
MNIDKTLLKDSFLKGDFNYFFKQAKEITDFVLLRKFSIYNDELRMDMSQECMENLWKKILANKVDPSRDLMAFIWQNSDFRIREILRKQKKRDEKAPMLDYDDDDAEWMKVFNGYVYNPELIVVYNEMVEEAEKLESENKTKTKKRRTKKIV